MSKRVLKNGFTLLELMVVIAIMAVLMGITIPAFTGIGRGSSMRGAIAQLRSTISLSRQWAVTHRVKTYILFPYFSSPDMNQLSYAEKACQAYAVYAVTNALGDGEYITEWKYLPSDLVFEEEPIDANAKNVFDVDFGEMITVPISGIDVPVYAIIFKPDGVPGGGLKAGMGYEVFLTEGYMNVFTNDISNPDYGFKPNGLRWSIEVAGNHGGIKVNERKQKN